MCVFSLLKVKMLAFPINCKMSKNR